MEKTQAIKCPSKREALRVLRELIATATWPEIDATTDAGAQMVLARWAVADASLRKLAQR